MHKNIYEIYSPKFNAYFRTTSREEFQEIQNLISRGEKPKKIKFPVDAIGEVEVEVTQLKIVDMTDKERHALIVNSTNVEKTTEDFSKDMLIQIAKKYKVAITKDNDRGDIVSAIRSKETERIAKKKKAVAKKRNK